MSIKIEKLASDSVLVKLNIPVVGHGRMKTVQYTRRYSGEPDLARNKGGIESLSLMLSLCLW